MTRFLLGQYNITKLGFREKAVYMKEFDLNIGKILEDWEVHHAIREIIANALDEQVLTNTLEIKIAKSGDAWCIRDYGRGINYHHLMQNENPEKTANDKVIGRFGVGLKDALATLFRHNIRVEIQSRHGVITLKESAKNTFDDIVTLHAQIAPPSDRRMIGTAFYIYNCPDCEIGKAKHMFLRFTDEEIIETTSYGQVIARNTGAANIYINGIKVAEEPNFAFSYNITALSKQIKKALNRERTNVGRTAYADRIKSILLEATSAEVIDILSDNLESMSTGTQCDEIKWVDVAAHVVNELNDSDDTVFVTPEELANTSGSTNEILQNSGKRIVFISESVKKKAEQESDGDITTISTVVEEYNDSFRYIFVDVDELTLRELENWTMVPALLERLGLSSWWDKCLISEQLKEDADNTVGVWDQELQKIIILRSQLQNKVDLFGTIIHEIIHASTGAKDVSRSFENELTEMIGKLSSLNMQNEDSETVEDDRFRINDWLASNIIDDAENNSYRIDTRRVALLSISGDVQWCVDCIGLFSAFTKNGLKYFGFDDSNTSFIRKCAVYDENSITYWLIYHYSNDAEIDFLEVTSMATIANMAGMDGRSLPCTMYVGKEISLLRDYMNAAPDILSQEYGSSKTSTYDGYLLISRSLLIFTEQTYKNEFQKDNIWKLTEFMRKQSAVSDKCLEEYLEEHTCRICGCYFTSYEMKCVECGFELFEV